jgi:hypothetical protein
MVVKANAYVLFLLNELMERLLLLCLISVVR